MNAEESAILRRAGISDFAVQSSVVCPHEHTLLIAPLVKLSPL